MVAVPTTLEVVKLACVYVLVKRFCKEKFVKRSTRDEPNYYVLDCSRERERNRRGDVCVCQ